MYFVALSTKFWLQTCGCKTTVLSTWSLCSRNVPVNGHHSAVMGRRDDTTAGQRKAVCRAGSLLLQMEGTALPLLYSVENQRNVQFPHTVHFHGPIVCSVPTLPCSGLLRRGKVRTLPLTVSWKVWSFLPTK